MMKNLIEKVLIKNVFKSLRIIVCYLLGVIEVEKRVIEEVIKFLGVRDVILMEELMVVVIGVGFLVSELIGSMIVDIGGGIIEVVIIFLGGIVISKLLRIVGDELD